MPQQEQLFGEANVAEGFLWLEEGLKFPHDLSIPVKFPAIFWSLSFHISLPTFFIFGLLAG